MTDDDTSSTKKDNKGRKSGSNSSRMSSASTGSSLPLEDTLSIIESASTTPMSNIDDMSRSSSVRSGAKGRMENSIIEPMDIDDNTYQNDDNTYQNDNVFQNDDYVDDNGFDGYELEEQETPKSNLKSGRNSSATSSAKRRVSFGADIKKKQQLPLERLVVAPKTPDSVSRTSVASTPGSREFTRGRSLPDETFIDEDSASNGDSDDDQQTSDEDKSGFTPDTSFLNDSINRRYLDDDEEDDDDADGGDSRVRRSRRATKGKRFAFWKGERPVYEKGDIVGLLKAAPTPAKRKREASGSFTSKPSKKESKVKKPTVSVNDEEDDAIVLPEGVKYLDRDEAEELSVWDESISDANTLRVLCYRESLSNPSRLPITGSRPPGKNTAGFAAQSFNIDSTSEMSGWITGFVDLPAGAIKDQEGVGSCAQVFFISECQDFALELGIADPSEEQWNELTAQRQLLKKGDTFYVPPGNIYRLENHSRVQSCMIYWTIIKPVES